MRKLGILGIGAVLLAVLVAAAAPAAENDQPSTAGSRWNPFRNWFGSDPSEVAEKTSKAKPGPAEDPPPGVAPRRAHIEAAAAFRAEEEMKLHRRNEVCDRLLRIASDSNDHQLERMALELSSRAWEAYQERTRNLTTAAARQADLDRLDRELPVTSDSAERLLSPGGKLGTRRADSRKAAVREVEP
jgi:hypothetical protein